MTFTIISNDIAQDPAIQSTWYDVDIDILVAAAAGRGVVSGCTVSAQGSPDMTVAVAVGVIKNAGGTTATVSAGNLTITAASGANPRVDLISATSAGVKTVTDGTAAASPKPPALPAGNIALAFILVGTSDTAIQNAEITDKRVIVAPPPAGASYIRSAGDYTTTSLLTMVAVDNTNLALTITTGAHRVRIGVVGTARNSGTSQIYFDIDIDGVLQGKAGGYGLVGMRSGTAAYIHDISFVYLSPVLTAASHTFTLMWAVGTASTATLHGGGTNSHYMQFWVEETFLAV